MPNAADDVVERTAKDMALTYFIASDQMPDEKGISAIAERFSAKTPMQRDVERLRKLLTDGWYVPGKSYPIISADADAWIKEVRTLGLAALKGRIND